MLDEGGERVAACGLAGGNKLETTVIPFILRGVNLLGVDSVMCPMEQRREAWRRLAVDLPGDKLDAMIEPAKLEDLGRLSKQILEGKVRGRTVVLEFPSYQAARDCYRSPEYQAAAALRKGKAEVDLMIIEGYDGVQPEPAASVMVFSPAALNVTSNVARVLFGRNDHAPLCPSLADHVPEHGPNHVLSSATVSGEPTDASSVASLNETAGVTSSVATSCASVGANVVGSIGTPQMRPVIVSASAETSNSTKPPSCTDDVPGNR